jgi:hypothetical protein
MQASWHASSIRIVTLNHRVNMNTRCCNEPFKVVILHRLLTELDIVPSLAEYTSLKKLSGMALPHIIRPSNISASTCIPTSSAWQDRVCRHKYSILQIATLTAFASALGCPLWHSTTSASSGRLHSRLCAALHSLCNHVSVKHTCVPLNRVNVARPPFNTVRHKLFTTDLSAVPTGARATRRARCASLSGPL